MTELSYNNVDYKGLVNLLAGLLTCRLMRVALLTEPLGKGFSAFNLPGGISVLVSETVFNSGITMHRTAVAGHPNFILSSTSLPSRKRIELQLFGEQTCTILASRRSCSPVP